MSTIKRRSTAQPAVDQQSERPLKDAITQVQEAKDALIAAVIEHARKDGSYQTVKWLFEFGGIRPAGHSSPEDEPSLLRLFLDQLRIPESPEETATEFPPNDHAVE